MKRKIILTLISSFILLGNSIAQSKDSTTDKPKGKFKLRQSFQSEDAKPEPAMITYTKPKGEKESFLIDAALGYAFPAKSDITITAYSEYHRNTLTEEESNTYQLGIASEWFTNKKFLSGDDQKNMSTTIINSNIEYSNDMLKKIESVQFSSEFTRLYGRREGTNHFLPNIWNQFGKFLAIEYFPSIGVEWESRLKTEKDSAKGNIGRLTGKLYSSFYPFYFAAKDRIELFVNGAFRYDVINKTKFTDKTHPSIEAGINFILSKSKPKASIGFSYNNIDDPGTGKEKQKFFLIAFKVKH